MWLLCRHQNSWNNNLLTYRTVNSNVLTYCSQFHYTYFLHSQFEYTYCTVNSNLLIYCTVNSNYFTYLLHSQFQSCPFLLAICWAFVIIIVNSLCVAFCCQRFAQGAGILFLLTFTFSETFKKEKRCMVGCCSLQYRFTLPMLTLARWLSLFHTLYDLC